MTIEIECFNVIIPIHVIDKKYPGGWEACRQDYRCNEPDSGCWSDEYLFRLGAMNTLDIEFIVQHWKKMGFKATRKNWKDFCIVSALSTLDTPCNWLEVDMNSGTAHFVGKVRKSRKLRSSDEG